MEKIALFYNIIRLFLSSLFGISLSFGFPNSDDYSAINVFFTIFGICGMLDLFKRFCFRIEKITLHNILYSFLLWYFFAFCHFSMSLHWISNALDIDKKLFSWLISLTNIGIPLVLASFYGIFGIVTLFLVRFIICNHKCEICGVLRCILFSGFFAFFWTLTELIRSYSILPFPWLLLGYSCSFSLEIMQFTYFTTIWGLSFAVAFFCAVLVLRSSYLKCQVFALFFVLCIFYIGSIRLSVDDNIFDEENFALLRIVQPNNNLDSFKSSHGRIAAFEKIVFQSQYGTKYHVRDARFIVNRNSREKNNGNYTVDYYVWPESALLFPITDTTVKKTCNCDKDHQSSRPETHFLQNLHVTGLDYFEKILPTNIGLIAGTDIADNNNLFNGMLLWDKKNLSTQIYKKQILVPFGEYIPWRKILNHIPVVVTLGGKDFAQGSSTQNNFYILPNRVQDKMGRVGFDNNHDNNQNMENELIVISPSICYEAIFPWPFANKRNKEADLLLNITNDMWFGNSFGAYQHLAMARVRAIENNKPLIRVANFGISSVFDNKGRIIASIPLNHSGIIDVKISKIKHKA